MNSKMKYDVNLTIKYDKNLYTFIFINYKLK